VVYPVTGKIFAAYVDVRPESSTFGRVEAMTFDCSKKEGTFKAVYVPPGVGNSLCVMGKETANYVYLVDEYWDNSKARGIAWDDPDLNIAWPVKNPIISERDKNNPTLRELFPGKIIK
jgi:dTDP-4-dehydrorhamnose 3,5-epimerase